MSDLENISDPPRWVLYLFPNGKRAQLCCHRRDSSCVREIPGRLARVIVLLQHASVEDLNLPGDLRGFRSAGVLARAFEENQAVEPPMASTMTAYLYKLCRILRIPTSAGKSFPPLIIRVRNSGARLLHPVEIRLVGCPPTTPRPHLSAEAEPADSA